MRKYLFVLMVVLVAGCSKQLLPPAVHSETSHSEHNEFRGDTLLIERTRIERQKGDTIYIFDSIVRDQRTTLQVHDTVEVHTTDSIPVEVPREKSKIEQSLEWSGMVLWALIVAGLLIGIIVITVKCRKR